MKTIFDFSNKKLRGEKISMITCYDYLSAKILASTTIDCILVGDSIAMTMYGYQHTISAEVSMIARHTEAVCKGAPNKFIIADLPFLSYRKSKNKSVDAVEQLMRAGAQAVKLEGAAGNLTLIQHLVESGVPVMGHIGLTAQLLHTLGGYKVQGKTEKAKARLIEEAEALTNAGCFALLLECMPQALAKTITERVSVPTIGIGAGANTDGQVLVWQDMLGMNLEFQPKFVKHYLSGATLIQQAVENYIHDVNHTNFPQDEHCYNN